MLLYNSIWGVGSLSQGFQAKKNGIRQLGFVHPPPSPFIGVGISPLHAARQQCPCWMTCLWLQAGTIKKKNSKSLIHQTNSIFLELNYMRMMWTPSRWNLHVWWGNLKMMTTSLMFSLSRLINLKVKLASGRLKIKVKMVTVLCHRTLPQMMCCKQRPIRKMWLKQICKPKLQTFSSSTLSTCPSPSRWHVEKQIMW